VGGVVLFVLGGGGVGVGGASMIRRVLKRSEVTRNRYLWSSERSSYPKNVVETRGEGQKKRRVERPSAGKTGIPRCHAADASEGKGPSAPSSSARGRHVR